jgi:hypothetical protein
VTSYKRLVTYDGKLVPFDARPPHDDEYDSEGRVKRHQLAVIRDQPLAARHAVLCAAVRDEFGAVWEYAV